MRVSWQRRHCCAPTCIVMDTALRTRPDSSSRSASILACSACLLPCSCAALRPTASVSRCSCVCHVQSVGSVETISRGDLDMARGDHLPDAQPDSPSTAVPDITTANAINNAKGGLVVPQPACTRSGAAPSMPPPPPAAPSPSADSPWSAVHHHIFLQHACSTAPSTRGHMSDC